MEILRGIFGEKDPKKNKIRLQANIKMIKSMRNRQTPSVKPAPKKLVSSSLEDQLFQNTCLPPSDARSVGPYHKDIYLYLLRVEPYFSPRRKNCQERAFGPRERHSAVDWMIGTCHRLKLKRQTLYLAVSLFDRYFELKSPKQSQLGLLALTSLFVAYKHEEIAFLFREVLALKCFDGQTYSSKTIYNCEMDLLVSLGWRLNNQGAMEFFDILAQGMALEPEPYHFAQYIIEALLITGCGYKFKNSLVASAVLCLVLMIFKRQPWTPKLTAQSLYTLDQVEEAAREIIDLLIFKKRILEGQSLEVKFKNPHFSKAVDIAEAALTFV